MKKFVLGVNLFINSFVFSQVGIGTTNPGATLEINNSNNDAVILKLKGNDNQDKLLVNENGEIYISKPINDENTEVILTLDDFNIIRYRYLNNIKPTGLERLNQGLGNGWRLIDRNPLNFAPIGYQVYSSVNNKIYTKISPTSWVFYSTNLVP